LTNYNNVLKKISILTYLHIFKIIFQNMTKKKKKKKKKTLNINEQLYILYIIIDLVVS